MATSIVTILIFLVNQVTLDNPLVRTITFKSKGLSGATLALVSKRQLLGKTSSINVLLNTKDPTTHKDSSDLHDQRQACLVVGSFSYLQNDLYF